MKITADTNILLRAVLDDDPLQSPIAKKVLADADLIAVTIPTLCEFVWTLRKRDRRTAQETAMFLRALTETANIVVDEASAQAGLLLLEAGGDFADGVIAFEGQRFGGESFATFDQKAAALISSIGGKTTLLTSS
jgi:predicted nucleic-acid-binding protein